MADSSGSLRVVGLISGTSVDGVDVAVADLRAEGGENRELRLTPLGHGEVPYPPALRDDLLAALPPGACTAERLTKLDTGVGQAFAEAALLGIEDHAGGHADLIASLGQTLYHWVEDGTALGTLQLGEPAWIAERTGLPVVSGFRTRDVAAGGHGAPLASTLDALWLRPEPGGAPRGALNIGGIANLTVVHGDGTVFAYDTGPGNALLDAAVTTLTGGRLHSDVDGALAARGTVHPGLLDRLLADPYYERLPPKSTGKEHFNAAYLDEAVAAFAPVPAEDLLATLTELTAATIASACANHGVRAVVASGGGLRNPALVRALRARITVVASDEHGLPSDAKEAYLTALLGWLTWHGLPGNVPGATGAGGPRPLGSITPGRAPLVLPGRPPAAPRRLRVASPSESR
ncbi:anhydro-N-acetylmuramic acid kinase [Prauserella marina]|uniref:Anhydro-N-acetylmuramic acid kinase n=1 Tax=Prauserella marina TaxID=530584 RepID=A0A222VLX3_9PSEU|nr:anhydro-N-acetylmuramic acid kinase [Prauserella marina]ASR34721.1 anhydro-N-acetylmuramic acid kinase [Prauserella marina]PWV85614.1 anhydro-N-acetylmuramic acid kinase [Prauserella marina]SDC50398.1 anhydro-N-acetylmuramic acid kinase [Prauserella marina]